jgi:hypothetical protein
VYLVRRFVNKYIYFTSLRRGVGWGWVRFLGDGVVFFALFGCYYWVGWLTRSQIKQRGVINCVSRYRFYDSFELHTLSLPFTEGAFQNAARASIAHCDFALSPLDGRLMAAHAPSARRYTATAKVVE